MNIEFLREKTLYIKKNINIISEKFVYDFFKEFNIVKIPLGFVVEEHLLILLNKKYVLVALDSEFIALYNIKNKRMCETNISHKYSTKITTFKSINNENNYEVADIRNASMSVDRYLAIPMLQGLILYLNNKNSFVKDELNEIKNIISKEFEERVTFNINERNFYEEYLISEVIYNNPEIDFIWNSKNPYNNFILSINKLNIINFDLKKRSDLIKLENEVIQNKDIINLYSDDNVEDFIESIQKSISLLDKGNKLAEKTKEIKNMYKIKKEISKNKKLNNEEEKKVSSVFQLVPHMKIDIQFSEDNAPETAIKKSMHIRINGKFVEIENIKHGHFKSIINIFNNSDFIFSNYLENNVFF